MDLFLHRTHFRAGTNGVLFHRHLFICFTIELPWLANRRGESCIPDGVYEIEPFYSVRFGNHIRLKEVADRTGILIHPANDASKELRGCIAPVTQLTGIGKGLDSRRALEKVLLKMEAARNPGQAVFLTVSSEHSGR